MKLLLSITQTGLISLWDTPEQRKSGGMDNELFYDLELTSAQIMLIDQAMYKFKHELKGDKDGS